MITLKADGAKYVFFRPLAGSYKNKFNRAVKLASMFDTLTRKFDGMFERGAGQTETARLALACKMMMYTGIRIGNEGSAEGYMTKPHPYSKKEPEFVKTYGLTTMLREHATVRKGVVYLNFIGKKQVENSFKLKGELAKQVKVLMDCSEKGEPLFSISAYELTKFIKKYVGAGFTPKDFRTMRANMVASDAMRDIFDREQPRTKTERNAEIKEIACKVSEQLNNTPSVCKKSYIDDMLFEHVCEVRVPCKRPK